MDRVTIRLCAVSLVASSLLACGEAGEGEGRRRVNILYTNDEHSHFHGMIKELDDFPLPSSAGDPEIFGHLARRAKVLRELRESFDTKHTDTITVSSGDQTQGALPQFAFLTTSPDFTLMKELGYDVMTLGNHEFDLGPQALADSMQIAMDRGGMPQWVMSNIVFDPDDEADDDLEGLWGDGDSEAPIKRYHVVTTDSGLRVGFIGTMGVDAAFVVPQKAPVRFSGRVADEGNPEEVLPALYEEIQELVDLLRDQEEVDAVVLLSHGGVDEVVPEAGEDWRIAENVTGLDLIVSGHSHTLLVQPQVVEAPDGQQVPVVQSGAHGQCIGTVELVVDTGERAVADLAPDKTQVIELRADEVIADDEPINDAMDEIMADLEANEIEDQLRSITGEDIQDDPNVTGDLYYMVLGQIDYDLYGRRWSVENNMLNLSTDAMLATAEELIGPTDVALQAGGNVHSDLIVGATGELAYSDLFRIQPLGYNPVDSSSGYPLARAHLYLVELKAALEIGVSTAFTDRNLANRYIFLGLSGARVEFDSTRDPQVIVDMADALDPQNGRITKITIDRDHTDGYDNPTEVVFDITRTGAEWESPEGSSEFQLYSVITTLYLASFADFAGVTLKDQDGVAMDLYESIVNEDDGTDVKAYESIIRYIYRECLANAGFLPSRYDESTPEGALPRRVVCTSGDDCPPCLGPSCPECLVSGCRQ